VSKMISLGSIIIAILYPVLIGVFYQNIVLILIAVLFASIVIVAHRQNIKRILNGTENKLSSKKNK
ncbi:MAG: glycerol-3-phosphate acyltransferase, partial [Eubacterium sp.]|nr:glycerol-3-phosphate acyltransferase [Eubacterium sp.]